MYLKSICLLGVLAAAGSAQTSGDVVFHQDFQGDTGGWTATGDTAKVAPASGTGGLVFTYELAPKIYSGVVSTAPPDLEKMRRIRFRVKTDHATAMGLVFSEKKPGGNYSAWFWSPANTWQWIELTPADFTVNDGPNDPKDSDGKLDLAEVEGIGLFDIGQFFAQLPGKSEFPLAVQVAQGQHTATIESLEVLSTPGAAPRIGENGLRIGTLDRDFLDWATPGGMELKLSQSQNPLKAPALQASYQQVEGQFQLLVRRMSGEDLANAKRLVFDIASDNEVTLMLSLEMSKPEGGQGPRFTMPLFPPGGKEVFHVNVDLADFHGDGKFDPSKWRTMAIVDISTASGGTPVANTIWIGNVTVYR
jgi:hypothetical protein